MIFLGPMPEKVRNIVAKLVTQARERQAPTDSPFLGFPLGGGAGCESYLTTKGEILRWTYGFDNKESIEYVEDAPLKVSIVAIAAELVPELAEWLPKRPPTARDCPICKSLGWINIQSVKLQCEKCYGLGWLAD